MFCVSKKWRQQHHSDPGSPSPEWDGCQRSSQASWEDREPSVLRPRHLWQRHCSCETVSPRGNEWLHISRLPGLKRQCYPPRDPHLGHWLGHHLQWYAPCLKLSVKLCFLPQWRSQATQLPDRSTLDRYDFSCFWEGLLLYLQPLYSYFLPIFDASKVPSLTSFRRWDSLLWDTENAGVPTPTSQWTWSVLASGKVGRIPAR